jgi:hypothetical protein
MNLIEDLINIYIYKIFAVMSRYLENNTNSSFINSYVQIMISNTSRNIPTIKNFDKNFLESKASAINFDFFEDDFTKKSKTQLHPSYEMLFPEYAPLITSKSNGEEHELSDFIL